VETAKGKTREDAINRLADRIDTFEKYTQPHSRLMAELAGHLARRFGLAATDIDAITEAAMLHDIGLYTMSPTYHAVPRPLSFEARLDLWRHPVIGEQQMAKRDSLRQSQLLVRWHHEWWNGSGYPDMLSFEDIPIGARILRAVELYSAMLCDRPYRAALDEQQALEALTASAGTECDPYVVSALLALLADLRAGIEQHVAAKAPKSDAFALPEQPGQKDQPVAVDSTPVLKANEPARDIWRSSVTSGDPAKPEVGVAARPWGEGLKAFVPISENASEQLAHPQPDGSQASIQSLSEIRETEPPKPFTQQLFERASSAEFGAQGFERWSEWSGSRNNKKELLGFQASVLRQLEFRSIAVPFWSEVRLDWYLKAWGKIIYANDSRTWAGAMARANVEAVNPLGEETITRILEDVYIPGTKLANPELRRWFSETDAWWMDNLRRNIESLEDQVMRAQALTLGLQTGDYALSFNEKTLELRRPLTTVFWRLAGRALAGPAAQPHNRVFNQPAEEFIKQARADLLYLRTPSSQAEQGGAQARSAWRETWIKGQQVDEPASISRKGAPPQSKQSYLAMLDRLFRAATYFKRWAVEYQEPELATAQDIVELIKEYRSVKATYSKDVTEVVGGLRSYIIVGESTSAR
jgi:HD domain